MFMDGYILLYMIICGMLGYGYVVILGYWWLYTVYTWLYIVILDYGLKTMCYHP